MKKLNLLLAGSMCVMLFAQSCKKNDADVKSTGIESIEPLKGTRTIPPGFLTGTIPNGTYKILPFLTTIDPATNKWLSADNNSNGTKIEQNVFANNFQRWRVTDLGSGQYLIINLSSGKAIDLPLGNTAEGTELQQYNPLHGAPQKWIIEYQGAYGVYRIKSSISGATTKGLHIKDNSVANDARVVLKTFAGSGATQHAGYFMFYPETAFPAHVTLHTPVSTKADVYPRVIRLANGNLMAAFMEADNNGFGGNAIIKIYRSTNGGASWTFVSDMLDTKRSLGAHDPEIFELPITMGGVPAGTLLMGIRAMGFLTNNFIDLYRSTNGGTTWTWISNIEVGQGWQKNVYEPHFMIDGSNRLLCYYSSELDSANYSQKLVYKVSTNGGNTWGSTVNVLTLSPKTKRPGMPRTTKMGNGKYMLVYENVGAPIASHVYYKTSTDGANWGTVSDQGTGVTIASGQFPATSPSVLWTPAGSPQGTVIVTGEVTRNPSTAQVTDNFINYNYGTGPWYKIPQPLPYAEALPGGYSRCIGQSADGNTLYHINTVGISSSVAETRFVATPAW